VNVSKSSDSEHLNNMCSKRQYPSRVLLNIYMNDGEFSDIETFQHSTKTIPLFMTGHKNCRQADYNNGRRILCSQN